VCSDTKHAGGWIQPSLQTLVLYSLCKYKLNDRRRRCNRESENHNGYTKSVTLLKWILCQRRRKCLPPVVGSCRVNTGIPKPSWIPSSPKLFASCKVACQLVRYVKRFQVARNFTVSLCARSSSKWGFIFRFSYISQYSYPSDISAPDS
jgi:hypothetical protein